MLSWYWMKGSLLRYSCRSLIRGTGELVDIHRKHEHIYIQKEHVYMNLLSALMKDIPTGIERQIVSAGLVMLQQNGQTLIGLREHW